MLILISKCMKYIIGLSTAIFFGVVLAAFPVRAQNLNVTMDTTVNVSSVGNFTLKSGSTGNSMTVDSSTMTFDMSSGQTVTLQSSQGYDMVESPAHASVTCIGSGSVSQLVLAPSSNETFTVAPSASVACVASSGSGSSSESGGGGGGGGGGAAAPATTVPPVVTAPKPTATLVMKTIEQALGGTVEVLDKSAAVTVPVGAFSGNAEVSITPTVSFTTLPRIFGAIAGQAFEISVKVGANAVKTFSKPLTLTFAYSDAMIKGLKPSTLKVQYYDEVTKKWVNLGGKIDASKRIITVDVTHLTLFVVTGEKEKIAMAGDLIKLVCPAGAGVSHPCRSVYYLGSDLKRYVFPNEVTYKSWYADFSGVIEIPQDELQSYSIRANVTMRPGTYLVKITTDPKTYAVEPGGMLRWIPSEEVALKLYGSNWAKRVVDVADPFFVNYVSSTAVINPVKDSAYPVGSVIIYASNPTTYYHVEMTKKRKFSAVSALTSNGFRTEFVITAPVTVTYENGTDVTAREDVLASIR